MSDEVYTEQPATVAVRLVDVQVHEPGFRTKGFTVATTMLDHKRYTAAWIGSVYRSRWLVELDIRSIKCSLGMNVIRAKTPEMVRTEFWSCLLAYNLIRAKNWCHIRTTNPIESTFATILLCHRKTKNNGSAKASLVRIFKLAQSAAKGWRKLRGHQHIPELIKGVRFIDGVIEQSHDELKSSTTKSPTTHTEIVA